MRKASRLLKQHCIGLYLPPPLVEAEDPGKKINLSYLFRKAEEEPIFLRWFRLPEGGFSSLKGSSAFLRGDLFIYIYAPRVMYVSKPVRGFTLLKKIVFFSGP